MKHIFMQPVCSRCIKTVTTATGYRNKNTRTKHTHKHSHKLGDREKRQTQMAVVLLGGAEGGMAPQGGGMTEDG